MAGSTSSSTAVSGASVDLVLARPESGLRRTMAWLGPDFGLVVAFTTVLAVLVAAYGGSYKWKEGPI